MAAGLTAVSAAPRALAAEPVRVAYQTVVEPAKVAPADGAYEKATGRRIFVIAAVAFALELGLLALQRRLVPWVGKA